MPVFLRDGKDPHENFVEKLTPPQAEKEHLLAEGKEIVKKTGLQHIGFIVDGNRRWAKSHNLPPIEGHRKAIEVILETIRGGAEMRIPVMSFWLLSTENWQRGEEFTSALFNLGREMKDKVREELTNLNVRFKTIGREDRLPEDLLKILVELEEQTRGNTKLSVLACIDYGGRDEIRRAANKMVELGIKAETEEEFGKLLDTAEIPNPDLVIRTAGEQRTSGFMLWQTAYSEWIFANNLFPDLGLLEFIATLGEFSKRSRRFGH